MVLEENIKRVRRRIEKACERSKRDPKDLTLVAVSKEKKAELITQAIDIGIKDIGENRVQEARAKFEKIDRDVVWHMVGHLQRNKVKKALEIFDMIQSVDSERLAMEISKRSKQEIEVLIEVNTSKEPTKYGVSPEGLDDLFNKVVALSNLKVIGLMTIGPGWAIEDPESSRPCFRLLADLRKKLEDKNGISLPVLSMGMSADFEIAVEEGSTMLRIGSAIFGPRCRVHGA